MSNSYDNIQLLALLQCKSIDTTCKNLGAYSHHSSGIIELRLGISEAGVSIIPCWIMNAVPITSNALNGKLTIAHARPGAKRKSTALVYSSENLCGAQHFLCFAPCLSPGRGMFRSQEFRSEYCDAVCLHPATC